MEEYIPRKVLPPRRNLPWLNKGIIQSIRRKNNLFKRAKNSPKDKSRYKRARNRVISQLRNAKRDYFHKLNHSNPKQFWKSVKILNKKNSSIPVLSQDSNMYSTDQEKADALNLFFVKNFNESISPITPLDSNYENDPCPNLLGTVEEVTSMLSSLDTTKASGPDGISGKTLKQTATAIAPSITAIFNLSIKCNQPPKDWK